MSNSVILMTDSKHCEYENNAFSMLAMNSFSIGPIHCQYPEESLHEPEVFVYIGKVF